MMKFTAGQIARARGLPKLATENTVAAVLDVPSGTLAQWRRNGTGPAYMTVRGQIVYSKSAVLSFLHRHLERIRS